MTIILSPFSPRVLVQVSVLASLCLQNKIGPCEQCTCCKYFTNKCLLMAHDVKTIMTAGELLHEIDIGVGCQEHLGYS